MAAEKPEFQQDGAVVRYKYSKILEGVDLIASFVLDILRFRKWKFISRKPGIYILQK